MANAVNRAYKVLIVFCIATLAGCTNGQAGAQSNPYDRLCVIYTEELNGDPSPGTLTFQKLSNRLNEELPEIKEQLAHLTNFSKDEFYPALKAMAEQHTGTSWECEFIKRRYGS